MDTEQGIVLGNEIENERVAKLSDLLSITADALPAILFFAEVDKI